METEKPLTFLRGLPLVAAVLLAATAGCGAGATIRPVGTVAGLAVGDSDSLLTAILSSRVTDGGVDYATLCNGNRLDKYIGYVAGTNPDTLPTPSHRLAFWINAYNAYTIKVICDNYPIRSINDLHFGGLIVGTVTGKTIWHRKFAVVGGKQYSLNDIEHEIIRDGFGDARAHFALVCAARSCPPLRAEAYTGEKLDGQLDDQGRLFFSQTEKNRFDVASRTAYLSKILDWYGEDFGSNDADILRFVARYLSPETRSAIESDPAAWSIRDTHYDWRLNEQESSSIR